MTLWSGRFSEDPDAALWAFTVDPSDRRLLGDDVAGSLAHVAMLGAAGILSREETVALTEGLDRIRAEADAGEFVFLPGDEDVHTAVERRLGELAGPVAGKLHTGRSRNDQVALDLRLYLARSCDRRGTQLGRLASVLTDLAEEHHATVVASYTHLQQAQAVSFGHHFAAYAWMLLRDRDRFADARGRIAVSPLGAGASGGSSLPLDPDAVAAAVGFPETLANSLDAVAARDFVAEFAFCAAQAMTHLSRLAEDLVLWSTAEFGWMVPADRHATGSSALPHKKNPDIAELARGKAATVLGDLTGLLALQKGLPLSYNRDLQEDKRAVFHADDTLALALDAMGELLAGATFSPPAPGPWVAALDLAELLVGRGVPFREAHAAVGGLVGRLQEHGRTFRDVTAAELEEVHERLDPADLAGLDPARSLTRRSSPGGGSGESVLAQVGALRRRLED